MADLTEKQQRALNLMTDAVAALIDLGPEAVQLLSDHVAEYGTDHEYGLHIDVAVNDCLDAVLDSFHMA